MSEPTRYVSVIPTSRLKRKFHDLDNNDVVNCRLCPKGFASTIALNNHARIEHIDIYSAGDPAAWTAVKEEPEDVSNLVEIEQSDDSQQVYYKIEPRDITMLASEDVSYIIVKSDDVVKKKKMNNKKSNQIKEEKVAKKENVAKKKKEPEPITGPFECLQPSVAVADGICHQIFFSCCEYSIHHRDEHAKRRKGFRCQVCEKPLACTGEEQLAPFPCEICGVGFQTSEELSGHTAITHVKLKPYECTICHKRFTQQGGVAQHMRMHTGDRPFPCTFCPKSFTQKSGLDQHLRTHTKVKPYRCIVCNKSFCQSVHLRQHMRTHTNVAPFQCGICEKRFKQSSHLTFHLKNHDPAMMSEEQRIKYQELIGVMNINQTEESQPISEIVEAEMQVLPEDQFQSVILEEPQVNYDI